MRPKFLVAPAAAAVLTVGAALVALAALAPAAQAGSLRGNVRDQATLAPLVGAYVTVQVVDPDSLALYAQTDGAGHYEILNIPPGNAHYVVSAAAAQHAASWASMPDVGSSDVTYDIVLPLLPPPPPPGDPDSTVVSGTVMVSSAAGAPLAPVAGASVSMSSAAGSFALSTNAAGHYSVIVPVGAYNVQVSATGCQAQNFTNVPVSGTSFVLDAALRSTVGVPPGPLAGFALLGAAPHPVRASGAVWFALPVTSRVTLRLYDVAGRLRSTLLEGVMPQGLQSVRLDAGALGSGVYLLRMEAAPVAGGRAFEAASRVVLMR